jgi:DNA-binding MarR family transcriptional regulator
VYVKVPPRFKSGRLRHFPTPGAASARLCFVEFWINCQGRSAASPTADALQKTTISARGGYVVTPTASNTAKENQALARDLSTSLLFKLQELTRDFRVRVIEELHKQGHEEIRLSHTPVFAALGLGGVRVTELARYVRVTQQAMGKMLKELERLGYVVRDVDPHDRRAKVIRLTDLGMQYAADSVEASARVRDQYAKQVGGKRLEQLDTLLHEILANLDLNYLPRDWLELDADMAD